MTQLAGQNGAGFANRNSIFSKAVYYAAGYNAIGGVFTTAKVLIPAVSTATRATIYVYSGVGEGAHFLAMSDEFDVTVRGVKNVPCFGTCPAGPVTIIVQPEGGGPLVFLASDNNASPSVDNLMDTASFPYRQPPPVLPAPTFTNQGGEPIITLEGSPLTGTGVVIGPIGLADSDPGNPSILALMSNGTMPMHQILDPVNKLKIGNTLPAALSTTGLLAVNVAAGIVPGPNGN